MTMNNESTDIAIIGAGPSGAIASALLKARGYDVVIVEKQLFPRFSIGESLLPQCMEFVEEAGMLDAVLAAGFQHKNGAAFRCGDKSTDFDFREKFSSGPGTTFQVQRAEFDHVLAQQAELAGVDVRYQHGLKDIAFSDDAVSLTVEKNDGDVYTLNAKFVLDASGFGRVLPRLLDLEAPSDFPVRCSVFTHIQDGIDCPDYDRDKILITIHPVHTDVWYWLIPFADGRCSVGVVADKKYFPDSDLSSEEIIKKFIAEAPELNTLLNDAVFDTPVQQLSGYSSNVKSLWGDRFALLGNAGEFLDPVFSSGVTIAMKSASLSAPLIDRQLQGEAVNWETEYAIPLKRGVDAFRAYVESWYEGGFQDVIFASVQSDTVREMICSILAGYAWDEDNPFVAHPSRRLNNLVELCRF